MQAQQEENLSTFLSNYFKSSNYRVFNLAGDASNRRYFRVVNDNQSWVLMKWEPFDPNNYPFLSVLNHFAKNQVHVPQVVHMSPAEGLVLLEDLGDLTLERKFWESQTQENSLEFYKMAIDELVKIHFKATSDKSPCTAFNIRFDTEKFMWEMNYAYDNLLLGICKLNLSETAAGELKKLMLDVCQKLDAEPKFIAHRDYHSRNLMIKLDQMRVIDFQDARLGPIQYDLVSLLRDSYVNLNEEMCFKLTEYYLAQAKPFLPNDFSIEKFKRAYELQTIQRCFKACGSFSSFYVMRNDTRYLKYISGTLKRVMKALGEFSEYKTFADVLLDSGALERKYEIL